MTLELTNTVNHSAAGQFLVRAAHTFAAKRAERRAYRNTRLELMALSDTRLKDLGLTRSQIDRASLEASVSSAH